MSAEFPKPTDEADAKFREVVDFWCLDAWVAVMRYAVPELVAGNRKLLMQVLIDRARSEAKLGAGDECECFLRLMGLLDLEFQTADGKRVSITTEEQSS